MVASTFTSVPFRVVMSCPSVVIGAATSTDASPEIPTFMPETATSVVPLAVSLALADTVVFSPDSFASEVAVALKASVDERAIAPVLLTLYLAEDVMAVLVPGAVSLQCERVV